MWVGRSSRRVPEERAASPQEVRAAVEALSEADLFRLDAFGRWRIRGLGRRAQGRTHEDLRNDAFRAALDGTRRWNRDKVHFLGFLIGAMQSISDNWGKRYRGDEAVLESDLGRDGGGPSILDGAPDAARSPEEELEYKQHVEAIRRSFADDPVLMRIVLDLEEGAKFPEIREQQGLGENEMHAAIRRLRRRLARQAEKVFHA